MVLCMTLMLVTCPGKKRRITFIECPPDLHGMLDAAKYADLVLLLVSGTFLGHFPSLACT